MNSEKPILKTINKKIIVDIGNSLKKIN